MKTLTIMRHAKSCWEDEKLDDFDRPLNKRGKKEAPEMGKRLADKKIRPDAVLSSPAKRAAKTARRVAEEIGYKSKRILYQDALYHCDYRTLMRITQSLNDSWDHVMFFGHNPGLTDFAEFLGHFDIDNIPTSGVLSIELDVNRWKEVQEGKGKLLFFDYPKRESEEDK